MESSNRSFKCALLTARCIPWDLSDSSLRYRNSRVGNLINPNTRRVIKFVAIIHEIRASSFNWATKIWKNFFFNAKTAKGSIKTS